MNARHTHRARPTTLHQGQHGRWRCHRLLAGLSALTALSALSWGCVTPVIPLPPPQSLELAVLDPDAGRIQISGRARPAVLVYVLNRNSGRGVIAATGEASGAFSAELDALDGDALDIWASRFADDAPSSVRCVAVSYSDGLSECE